MTMTQYVPLAEVEQAFITALTGITVGGVAIPVYTTPPADVAEPYIDTGENMITDWSTKTGIGTEHLATLHIWDVGRSKVRLNRIASLVTARLALTTPSLGTDYAMTLLRFESLEIIREDQADVRYWHGVLRFRMLIEQV